MNYLLILIIKLAGLDNTVNFNSYKNISSSNLVIGAPSTLLREASVYPNTKILCFDIEKKVGKLPFMGLNNFYETSYEKFEEKLNFLLKLNYSDYIKNLDKPHDYLMHKIDTIDCFLEFLEKQP